MPSRRRYPAFDRRRSAMSDTTATGPAARIDPAGEADPMSLDTPRAKNLALLLLAMTQFVIVIDASIVNVALPSIGAAPALLARQPLVGRQRLHAHVRRLPAARRPARRPARAQAHVHARPGPLLARLARRRPRPVGGVADRRARRPGPRRGDRLAGGAVDHHHDLRRRRRAQPRARHLGCGRGRRRRGRGAARRDPHERAELALGAVRQRPDRARRGGARAADCCSRAAPKTAPKASTCRAR